MIEKLKQELAAEREKTSHFAVVPPGAGTPSETVASLHAHEGSAAFAGSGASVPEGSAIVTGSGALDSVLVHDVLHDGVAAVEGLTVNKEISDSRAKKVTFSEPGKVHEVGSSVGGLGLSDGGGIGSSGVTTSQSMSGSASDSDTTMVTPLASSSVSVVTARPTCALTSSLTSSSDVTSLTSVVNTRPTLTSLSASTSGVNSNVVATASANGTSLFTGGSLGLENVSGAAGIVNVPVVSGTTVGNSANGVMQQLTQLVQTQTAMVAAQTRAMSAQFASHVPL